MKLYAIYSQTHEVLKEEWFLPSLRDSFELNLKKAQKKGGDYRTEGFKEAVLEKSDLIIGAIQENIDDVFVYSDVDIQFFKPVEAVLRKSIETCDVVCQQDSPMPDPTLCTGFFVMRGSERTLRLWQSIKRCVEKEGRDQPAFNRLLRHQNQVRFWTKIKYDCLPRTFFGGGTLTGKTWEPGLELPVPRDILLHHANWTIGVQNKIAQLNYVKGKVLQYQQG